MRTVSIVGIGTGNPEHLTVMAIRVLGEADAVFLMDKGEVTRDLLEYRQAICGQYTSPSSRVVTAADPERDRTAAAYRPAVAGWRAHRAGIYERLITDELGEDEKGVFLAWGDPAIYDSTLHVLDEVLARGSVPFDLCVVPGISSIQALAAQHRISLTRTGRPLHLTTGRLMAEGFPGCSDDVAVMLDASGALGTLDDPGLEVYWGAYLGSADEILVSGPVTEVAQQIAATREAARDERGWIMDTYLLRRRDST